MQLNLPMSQLLPKCILKLAFDNYTSSFAWWASNDVDLIRNYLRMRHD